MTTCERVSVQRIFGQVRAPCAGRGGREQGYMASEQVETIVLFFCCPSVLMSEPKGNDWINSQRKKFIVNDKYEKCSLVREVHQLQTSRFQEVVSSSIVIYLSSPKLLPQLVVVQHCWRQGAGLERALVKQGTVVLSLYPVFQGRPSGESPKEKSDNCLKCGTYRFWRVLMLKMGRPR